MERRKTLFTMMTLLVVLFAVFSHYLFDPWGFYWKVAPEEEMLRTQVVETAERYLGCSESDGSHKVIIDRYNSHKPLAQGYQVQYTDSWCSTFVSAIAIECDLTQIIPTECGCERQIGLFQDLSCWIEDDSLIPLPGDMIFYDWNMDTNGECTGWSDHVGIVVGTKWPFIKVIEGNKEDQVAYRIICINNRSIRGFAKPAYTSVSKYSPRY